MIHVSAPKQGFEETLLENVVLKEICAGCAACVLVWPYGCLEYFEEKPNLIKKCETCGICPRVCPRFDFSQATLEKMVFQREHKLDEEFGIYRRLVIARASDENILHACQDGGVVSALLIHALNNGIIDSAIVSATRQKRKSLAFVSTPCQIQALRKIEAFPLKKYSNLIKFTIGLMCTESFTYTGLMQKHIQETLGVNLNDVKKVNIKGKVLVTTKTGETKAIPLQEAKQYTRTGCLPCMDFSAELADISAGGL